MSSRGTAALDRMIAKCRKVSGLVEVATPEARQGFEAGISEALARGGPPDGGSWAAKKSGGRPLANASRNAVTVVAIDTTLVARTNRHYFFHHTGRGVPQRRVLPERLTPELAEPIRAALSNAWRKIMG